MPDLNDILLSKCLLRFWFVGRLATIRAPASRRSRGQISGIGFAQAKTIASAAIDLIHSGRMISGPGAEKAMPTAGVRQKEGLWIAQQASAEFHLLHSIDYLIDYLTDAPKKVVTRYPVGGPLRRENNEGAQNLLDAFVKSLDADPAKVNLHLSWGTAWQKVARLTQHLNIDLVALGTVGRSGLKGVFLGNTSERILTTCDCSILTVKPEDFVSPLAPGLRPLPSDSENEQS